ncbi:MAG: methyltransferase domain-containing protein [Enterobacterales bacterium]|nr:methyltransferase domain-containing protein [Enterobacterales bacterium]
MRKNNLVLEKIDLALKAWRKMINSHKESIPKVYFEQAKSRLADVLSGIFGYYALLYSDKATELVGDNLVIRHSLTISKVLDGSDIVGHYEALPIATDSIDLLVLPEILRHSSDPHQILREAERVLIPEGYILLLVANPLSVRGMKHRLLEKLDRKMAKTHWIGKGRLADWFGLLGFEVTDYIAIGGTAKWLSKEAPKHWYTKLNNRLRGYFASYLIIVAKKKVSTLTPIRPSWRSNPKLVGSRLADPSVTSEVDSWMQNFKRL